MTPEEKARKFEEETGVHIFPPYTDDSVDGTIEVISSLDLDRIARDVEEDLKEHR